jgi:hypothetical protein
MIVKNILASKGGNVITINPTADVIARLASICLPGVQCNIWTSAPSFALPLADAPVGFRVQQQNDSVHADFLGMSDWITPALQDANGRISALLHRPVR